LAIIGLAGVGIFLVTVSLLHWLQPELDAVNEAVSYYVHGNSGWLLIAGLIALGVGSVALTIGVRHTLVGSGVRIGYALLAIWSIGVLIAGIFPADPPGNWNHLSTGGMIHGNAALVAILALPASAILLARGFRRDVRWQQRSALLSVLAVATVISMGAFMTSLIPVMISPGPPSLLGLTERILLAAYAAWLSMVAVGLCCIDKSVKTQG
jgi:hypothetical protein